MRNLTLITAVCLVAASTAVQAEPDHQELYTNLVPKYEHANSHVKMLKRQTQEFRKILDRHGIDYSQQVVIMGDDGIVRDRIDLSEDPWPVDLRAQK